MTAIGKMLLFLVLILSLVWNFLTVSAYVARTNWRAEAKRSQDDAQKMQDAAQKMKTLLDAERESAADALRAVRQERDNLRLEVKTLQANQDTLSAQYSTAFVEGTKRAASAVGLQENINKLQLQVRDLDAAVKAKDTAVTELTLARDKALVDANNARLTAAGLAKQNENLQDRLLKAQSDAEETKRYGTAGAAPGTRTPAAPDGFRGTVTEYAKADRKVALTPGLDSGLQKGTTLTVARLTGGGKYLGTVTVTLVNPKEAVGTFRPAATTLPRSADDLPMPGDVLTPTGR